jgi:hypothetical protein
MKQVSNGCWAVETAGLGSEMFFESGPVECGSIKDGVAIDIKDFGSWVISAADILQMATLVSQARGRDGRSDTAGGKDAKKEVADDKR